MPRGSTGTHCRGRTNIGISIIVRAGTVCVVRLVCLSRTTRYVRETPKIFSAWEIRDSSVKNGQLLDVWVGSSTGNMISFLKPDMLRVIAGFTEWHRRTAQWRADIHSALRHAEVCNIAAPDQGAAMAALQKGLCPCLRGTAIVKGSFPSLLACFNTLLVSRAGIST